MSSTTTATVKKSRSKSKRVALHVAQPRDSDPMSSFFTCPKGHKLPHRVVGKGRCAPFDCCEAKGGAWQVVRVEEKKNHADALAFAEETSKIVEMRDRMRAWNEAHPLPTVPAAPKTKSIAEYMRRRLEQAAPLALERRIRTALLDPGHQGEVAARELLNRSGYTERPEAHYEFNGPVLIVGDAAKIAAESPYAVQGQSQLTRSEVIDGSLIRKDGEVPADAVAGDVAVDAEVE